MAADQRFVVSVRIIGAVHRDAPKLKMFMISVLWSDEADVIIYRSFHDFKKFHRQLKKRFPLMNPFRRNNRVIPKFRGKARRGSLQQKGSKRSVQRMRFLESYCDELLKCDQTVSQSAEVTQFFMPKDRDLQPDFTKNSVMILVSDDLPDGPGGGGGGQHGGGISHPFVTQTYRCVSAYETKDTKNRPFKVAVDEKLDVLIKDPAGWWLVENEDKRLAWFPAPYLELWDGEDDDDDEGCQLGGALYCAARSYSTKMNDEVSVPIGSVVEVLRKSVNGWWLIRFNGKSGYIPSMYLQPYNNPRAGLFSLQRKLHSSTLNLATSREPQAPQPGGAGDETSPGMDSAAQAGTPPRLHKARSLDVLGAPAPEPGRERSMTTTSEESSLSGFSSISDSSQSSSSLQGRGRSPGSPDLSLSDRRASGTGSESSGSVGSVGSEGAPRVPPRPKAEEIMTRCTTMTRKAAMASKSLLQIKPESVQSR